MQFINIVVHSVENMNFRVHLQYEFSHQGLDEYLEVNMIQQRVKPKCLVLFFLFKNVNKKKYLTFLICRH